MESKELALLREAMEFIDELLTDFSLLKLSFLQPRLKELRNKIEKIKRLERIEERIKNYG